MPPLETSNIGSAATAVHSVPAAPAAAPSEKKTPQAQAPKVPVEQVVQQLNELVQAHNQSVEFSVIRSSAGPRVVVMVRDTETNEVVRQIPSADMVAIDEAMTRLQGVLFRKTV